MSLSEGVCVNVKAFGFYPASGLNPEMTYSYKFYLFFFYLCLEMVYLGKSLPLVCYLYLHIKRLFNEKVRINYMRLLPEIATTLKILQILLWNILKHIRLH